RFAVGSRDYQTIRTWIQEGASYGVEGERVQILKMAVFPTQAFLDPGWKRQLLVTGHLSNARSEDLTERVLYESNNPEAVRVDAKGVIEAVKPGEADIIVRGVGHIASARIGVIARRLPDYPAVARRNFIDDHIFTKLRK